ncbi:unnamed protein product, partial [Mesorhabditis belari]|uniref:Pepsin inhibitor-3-like repeated domain-containing protein n=1 Tax=Mesorhabditis belari TaxID=2138241 RepID=A0AAF3EUJ9_9BILA
MRSIVLFGLLAVCISGAPREKRFAALGLTTTGLGGTTGCVVTDNVLYANGFKQRELSESEMSELEQYREQLADYKKQVKSALEKKRNSMKKRFSGNDMTRDDENEVAKDESLKAPKKPSFCKEEDTTQYIFDGCMVQNNKVYIGREYARDLTTDEVKQLKIFDAKMTVYQKWAQKQMQKQMKGLFGGNDFFSAIFGGRSGASHLEPTTVDPEADQPPPEAPEAPKFCTAIY